MTDRLTRGDPGTDVVPAGGGAVEPGGQYGGGQGGATDEAVPMALQIGRMLNAILRYKWLVIAIVVLGTAASIGATRFITPEYRAAGTIYIESNSKSRTPLQGAQLLQEDSWLQLIRSFAVLDPVVRSTKLYLQIEPEDSAAFGGFALGTRMRPGRYRLLINPSGQKFALHSGQGFVVDTGAVGDSIGREQGFRWAPPANALGRDREIKFTVNSPREAATALRGVLRPVIPGRDAVFMDVSMTGSEPEQVAQTLNAVLDQFLTLAATLKKEKLQQIAVDLERQLGQADSVARLTENALEHYRIETITEPREDLFPLPAGLASTQPTVMSNFYSKQLSLATIQKDRKAIEEVLRQGRDLGAVPVDAFHTIGTVRQAPGLVGVLAEVTTAENEIRTARIRYTDEHKIVQDLRTRLDDLRNRTVPEYAQRLVEQLKAQEAVLRNEIDAETEELRKIPIRTLAEEKLRRQAASAIGLTQNLQQRLTDNRLSEMNATPDVSILDRAEIPTRPSSNTAPRIILMGVAASIGFALVLAILLDRFDRRFRYPEQASHDLGLTILGAVPVIRRDSRGLRSPAETAQIIESFRSIRLNLAHSFPPEGPIVVTITSPNPGDGKSLICANLAISFSDAGYETLLIDGDTRRGEQHKTFEVERRPGLLDVLDAGLPIESALYQTQHERLTVMPSGSRLAKGPELLGSSRMTELTSILRNRYQVILVDSPPLGAGVDSFVLGTATGAVAVVLRSGETDRQLAEAKLQLLERLPIRLVGAVLNHIDVGHGAYKYYAYEYSPEPAAELEEPMAEPASSPLGAGR